MPDILLSWEYRNNNHGAYPGKYLRALETHPPGSGKATGHLSCTYMPEIRLPVTNKGRAIISGTSLAFLCPFPLKPLTKVWKKKSEMLVAQSCLTLSDPMDAIRQGSSVHDILQARILEWVAIPFSRGSSWLRDWTQVYRTAVRFFTVWAIPTGKWIYTLAWIQVNDHLVSLRLTSNCWMR